MLTWFVLASFFQTQFFNPIFQPKFLSDEKQIVYS